MRAASTLIICAVVTLAAFWAPAAAHPGAPFVTAAYVRSLFSLGPGEFDYRSVSCVGIGTRIGKRFRHFRCRSARNDGLRSTFLVHPTSDGDFEPSFLEASGPGVARKRVVQTKSITGDFPVVSVSAHVNHPAVIAIRVFTKPDQWVDGNWVVVCTNDAGAASKSGEFRTANLGDGQVRLPFFQPDECSVSATVSGSRGRLKVQIVAYIP